jgi:transcriptional regulator with XRE-family HTH domain
MDLGKPAPPIPVADAGGLDQDDTGHGVARAIGYQVRIARNRHGMTVARVAQLTGLSPGMLSKIENGNALPSLTTLHALSRVFKVPMTLLLRDPRRGARVLLREEGRRAVYRKPRLKGRPSVSAVGAGRRN